MSNILGLVTVNDKLIYEVDDIPSVGAGTPAPVGSIAMYENGSNVGTEYLKTGPNDVDWDRLLTLGNGNVLQGNYLRIPIYNTDASGYTVDDVVTQNSQNIDIQIVSQPTRSAAIEYRVPNPGDAVTAADFVLTEGAQSINGLKTFNDGITVNGTLTFVNTTNLEVTDKLIRLNKNGAVGSGGGSGFEIEENTAVTGYFKTAANRQGWDLLAPANAYVLNLDQNNLTANRTQKFADTAGTFVMRPDATIGVAGQIAYWQDANNLISASGFTYAAGVLTVPNATLSSLGLGIVHSSAAGVLSSSAVVLTSEVSGVLPVANGGTNSSTALSNGRLMYSNAGAIVEYSAMQPNQVYFGAAITGLPSQSVNLFWDIVNSRLGIGTNAPTRSLHVAGSSLFNGPIRYADANALKANWEVFQAQYQTTNATSAIMKQLTIATDSEFVVTANIIGRDAATGNSAAYFRTAKFKNVTGTISMASVQTDFTAEDVKAWDGTLVYLPAVAKAISNVALTTNVVTVTTTTNHGYIPGQSVTVAAVTNTDINGTFVITAVTNNTFSYALTHADITSGVDTGSATTVAMAGIQVTGASSTTVDWAVTYFVQTLS